VLDAVDPVTFLKQADGVGPATAERIAAALGGTMDSIREVLSQPQDQAVSALMAVPRVSRSVAVGLKQMWDESIACGCRCRASRGRICLLVVVGLGCFASLRFDGQVVAHAERTQHSTDTRAALRS
jgi:hypothetical protein